MENKLRMCVPCHFGLESVLAYEIKKIGGENLTTTDGKISFEGGFDVLAKGNLWIATGERVLIELGSFRAESFEQLFDGVMNLPAILRKLRRNIRYSLLSIRTLRLSILIHQV